MESGNTLGSMNGTDWRNYKPSSSNLQPNTNQTKQPARSRGAGVTVIAVLALLFAIAGTALGAVAVYNTLNNNQPVATPTVSPEGYYTGNTVEFEETSIAGIVSKVTPAVVSIVSESYRSSYYGMGSISRAAGTGMIVSSDGYIITNKHVIDGARNIQVILDNGDSYDNVKLLGTDPLNDVAYLKIDGAKDLPTIPLGDSKTIAVGQPVLAIGNALGAYQNSVTQGIIGGTGRSVTAGDSSGGNIEYLTDMLQTDAAINPGNSGGPLVNAAGEVIGINTAVSTDAQGLGFAIPISAVKGMLNYIMETGKAERSYLGVSYITVTSEVMKQYNLPVSSGAYVYNENSRSNAVVKGGPADKAGIKTGDVITKVNGIEVGRAGSVSTLVGEYKVGDTITLTINRNKQEMTVNVTLEAYKE